MLRRWVYGLRVKLGLAPQLFGMDWREANRQIALGIAEGIVRAEAQVLSDKRGPELQVVRDLTPPWWRVSHPEVFRDGGWLQGGPDA